MNRSTKTFYRKSERRNDLDIYKHTKMNYGSRSFADCINRSAEELKEIKQQQVDDKKCLSEIRLKVGGWAQKLEDLEQQLPTIELAPIISPILDRI